MRKEELIVKYTQKKSDIIHMIYIESSGDKNLDKNISKLIDSIFSLIIEDLKNLYEEPESDNVLENFVNYCNYISEFVKIPNRLIVEFKQSKFYNSAERILP